MDIRLPQKDSATSRGIRTGIFSAVGTIVALAFGLFMAINGVPGCPEAITDFIGKHYIEITGLVGIFSGAAGFVYNALFRKEVKNY